MHRLLCTGIHSLNGPEATSNSCAARVLFPTADGSTGEMVLRLVPLGTPGCRQCYIQSELDVRHTFLAGNLQAERTGGCQPWVFLADSFEADAGVPEDIA